MQNILGCNGLVVKADCILKSYGYELLHCFLHSILFII